MEKYNIIIEEIWKGIQKQFKILQTKEEYSIRYRI